MHSILRKFHVLGLNNDYDPIRLNYSCLDFPWCCAYLTHRFCRRVPNTKVSSDNLVSTALPASLRRESPGNEFVSPTISKLSLFGLTSGIPNIKWYGKIISCERRAAPSLAFILKNQIHPTNNFISKLHIQFSFCFSLFVFYCHQCISTQLKYSRI